MTLQPPALILCLALLLPTLARAESKPMPFANPRSFWVATPAVNATDGESKSFFRFIRGQGLLMNPASVTYLKLPFQAQGAAQTPDQLIQSIGRGMGIGTWYHRSLSGADAWDSYWPGNNRFIRVYYKKSSGFAEYSVALYRPVFADKLMLETELIQRQLLGLDGHKASLESIRDLLTAWLMIPEAQASGVDSVHILDTCCKKPSATPPSTSPPDASTLQGLASGLQNLGGQAGGVGTSVAGTNVALEDIVTESQTFRETFGPRMDAMNGNLSALNGNLATSNGNWATTNGHLADANANWATSNQKWDTSNQNWAQTNTEISKFRDAFTTASADANKSAANLTAAVNGTNEQMAKMREFMEKASSSGNVARVAFSGAAGAAAGVAVADAGIALVTAALRKLHVIPKNQAERDRAEQALKQNVTRYNTLRAQVQTAERSADQLIKTVLKLKSKGYANAEDALNSLNTRMVKGEHIRKYGDQIAEKLMAQSLKAGGDGENAGKEYEELVAALGALDTRMHATGDARDMLQKGNISKVCDSLSDIVSNLRKSENDLFLVSLDLGAQREALADADNDDAGRMQAEAKNLDKQRAIASANQAEDRRAKRDKDLIVKELTDERDTLAKLCEDGAKDAWKDTQRSGKELKSACSDFVEGRASTDQETGRILMAANTGLQDRLRNYRDQRDDQPAAIALIEKSQTAVQNASEMHADQGKVHVSPLSIANAHAADAALTAQLLEETTAEYQRKKLRELAGYESGAADACEFMGGKLSAQTGASMCATPDGAVDPMCLLTAQSGVVNKSAAAGGGQTPPDQQPQGSTPPAR